MPVATSSRPTVTFHSLFPALEPVRPLGWFFAEELLEARAGSDFPTNSRGQDEDVNIYLVGLLSSWTTGDPRRGVQPGRDPLLLPEAPGSSRMARVEHLRRQADHRLLALGLFDRGDLVRRRRRGWRMTEAETHARDMTVAGHCFELAARLLAGSGQGKGGLAVVLTKLAAELPGYVHVLQTLARRRFGLGARLGTDELQRLLSGL